MSKEIEYMDKEPTLLDELSNYGETQRCLKGENEIRVPRYYTNVEEIAAIFDRILDKNSEKQK